MHAASSEPPAPHNADSPDTTEPATIPFYLPAPPESAFALLLIASFVIVGCSFAAGYCVAVVKLAVERNAEYALFAVVGFFLACAVGWSQLVGVFRPHDSWANFVGNLLVGSAAMIAVALAGIPLVSAQPILLRELLGYGGMIVFLSIAGHLNLAWSRQLRAAGWKPPGRNPASGWTGWTFSVRELPAIFTAIAVGCVGYVFCARSATEANLREQWRHEQWRQLRIIDAEIEESNRARLRPFNPAGASTKITND